MNNKDIKSRLINGLCYFPYSLELAASIIACLKLLKFCMVVLTEINVPCLSMLKNKYISLLKKSNKN
jgi:hypothetical protein